MTQGSALLGRLTSVGTLPVINFMSPARMDAAICIRPSLRNASSSHWFQNDIFPWSGHFGSCWHRSRLSKI